MTEEELKSRIDYGISEEEFEFKRDEIAGAEKTLKRVEKTNTAFDNFLENFERQYLRNEQVAFDNFEQLAGYLAELNDMVNQNFYYKDMQLMMKVEIILLKYKEWANALRQNSFLAREKMAEIQSVVDKEFITKEKYNTFKEEAEETFKELGKGDILEVKKYEKESLIIIPSEFKKKYKDGVKVKINLI